MILNLKWNSTDPVAPRGHRAYRRNRMPAHRRVIESQSMKPRTRSVSSAANVQRKSYGRFVCNSLLAINRLPNGLLVEICCHIKDTVCTSHGSSSRACAVIGAPYSWGQRRFVPTFISMQCVVLPFWRHVHSVHRALQQVSLSTGPRSDATKSYALFCPFPGTSAFSILRRPPLLPIQTLSL